MLPCDGEIADFTLFDELADHCRITGESTLLPSTLFEEKCFKCGSTYERVGVKSAGGTLHTLRGRIALQLLLWICACGTAVPYDGAKHSLFVAMLSTVFTRKFMGVMPQAVFTGHSTLSSASAGMCFLLAVTRSMCGARASLTRQTLIKAVHRCSRTLIVPASLFHSLKCYLSRERSFPAVIVDGEVISEQRNQSEALMRVECDVPVVPLNAALGACLPSPALRAFIRLRVCLRHDEAIRLTKGELKALETLRLAIVADPDPHPAGLVTSHPRNVAWAASYLFFMFYVFEPVPGPPAPDADPGGNPGGAAAPPPVAAAGEEGAGGAPWAVPAGSDEQQLAPAAPLPPVVPALIPADKPGDLDERSPTVFKAVSDAFVGRDDDAIRAERWLVVQDFMCTFLAEPVLGALAGLKRAKLKRLSFSMARCTGGRAWLKLAVAAESVAILYPILLLIGAAEEENARKTRAIGELLLFTCGVDA